MKTPERPVIALHAADETRYGEIDIIHKSAMSLVSTIKHGAAAMVKANPEKGKESGGGSIILTASGTMHIKGTRCCIL